MFQRNNLLLQFGSFRDTRVFEFLELLNVERAVGKAVVNSVGLGFDEGEFAFEPVNLRLLLLGRLGFLS